MFQTIIQSDEFKNYVMNMDYLVHDFYSMCKTLKRHSRTVFIDMGASLVFHGAHDSPAGEFVVFTMILAALPNIIYQVGNSN